MGGKDAGKCLYRSMQISVGGMLSGKYMIQINQNGKEGKLKGIFRKTHTKTCFLVINCVGEEFVVHKK
jgi:hypothetical protein